jgi:hypothetical protein
MLRVSLHQLKENRQCPEAPDGFCVRAMIDLAYPFLCPTVLLAVVPIAEQTGLHVSDGLQTGMLWIT